MQKSKVGFVMFNGKFEDGGAPQPPLVIHATTTTTPSPPLPTPLLSSGAFPLNSLLSSRSRSLQTHLESFKKGKKKATLEYEVNGKLIIKQTGKKKKGVLSLQEKIMNCKDPQEIETLLIHEGIVPTT